ncbi:MAG: peptide chain release factor N(5)-glutamine methyltransferase [Candidatus Pacebacteria bacterium]|nr:peptide chain release factor N(5)-glutamine methyltransferase [Candidatus Paceibacterota bacterium]
MIIRDKYNGNADVDLVKDMERLAAGEPLAYIIGWIPFLGLKISLEPVTPDEEVKAGAPEARPLIPRPETEWWTEKLIDHLQYRFGAHGTSPERPFQLLDLCAGSGAIGLAILSHLPNAYVTFGELNSAHTALIRHNLTLNNLDANRADIRTSDLFENLKDERFDIIATNPPYIPDTRALDDNVTRYEPSEALFSGSDGLTLIRRILKEAPQHLTRNRGDETGSGELWMECDIENIAEAEKYARAAGAGETTIHPDLYGRPRLLIATFPQLPV